MEQGWNWKMLNAENDMELHISISSRFIYTHLWKRFLRQYIITFSFRQGFQRNVYISINTSFFF